MSRVYLETEHQELFYPASDLHAPIRVHVPSALGKLGYFVCVRLDFASAAAYDASPHLSIHLTVAGLRPDDVTLKLHEGLADHSPRNLPAAGAGMTWRIVARARVSRGDGVLEFHGLPVTVQRGDVLLCTWLRYLESGEADQWLACQADPQWAPNGVPLGGIGSGKVEISRDGRFRNFSGNNNQDMPFEEPDGLAGAFVSVAMGVEEVVLATRPVHSRGLTLKPVPKLESDLAFPRAVLRAPGAVRDLDVTVTFCAPLVPHDDAVASLPGFIGRVTIHNRNSYVAQPRLRLAWPNLVGQGGGIGTPETNIGYADGSYRFWTSPASPTADIVTGHGWRALRYGNAPSPVNTSADGHHWLAMRGSTGDVAVHPDAQFGSVVREFNIAPGGTATVDFVVAWEMPHWIDQRSDDRGHFWQTIAADGNAILDRLFGEADHILSEAGALGDLVRRTDLPTWLADRLLNSCYPLVTNSVFYRDGRFSINEGPTEMCGCYGTIDQRLGSHAATQHLFPQLNAGELNQFGAYQSPNGGINHDLGHAHLERGPQEMSWPDLTCSFIIQTARHSWSTGDAHFEALNWPRAVKALRRHSIWADAGDGVAQVGHGLGTSYDGYHYEGTTPYVATLWIAALKVMRRWAAQHTASTDPESETAHALIIDIDRWLPAAEARLEADLWNGSFYRAYAKVGGRINENCHAGMLAGQYYARALAGDDVLPPERLASCADAWFKLNGADRYQVPPDECAPDGSAGSEYGWLPYVESFGLAPLASIGDKRVLPVFERMVGHMTEHGRRPCDTRLMYQPVTGEISWGSYYMTAPASWLVYEALLDIAYSPVNGVLRLLPQLDGSFPVVHPRFWALGRRTVDAASGRIALTLEVVRTFGGDPLPVKAIELPYSASGIRVGETSVPTPPAPIGSAATGVYRALDLPTPTALAAGVTLAWSWQPA